MENTKTPTDINNLDTKAKTVLMELSNGRAYTLIEITSALKFKRDDTEEILRGLISHKLIKTRQNRRRTYYYMEKSKIEDLIQAGVLKERKQRDSIPTEMKYCRHCYKHLAGYIGVKSEKALVHNDFIRPKENESHYDDYKITPSGYEWFHKLGISIEDLEKKRGRLTKQCLDFSERKNHLGGKLGDALLSKMEEKNWLTQVPNSREIRVTEKGQQALEGELGLILD